MSEIRALIDELLAPRFSLDEAQCAQFARYYELLVDWNTTACCCLRMSALPTARA